MAQALAKKNLKILETYAVWAIIALFSLWVETRQKG
jgi:hypothetical protein